MAIAGGAGAPHVVTEPCSGPGTTTAAGPPMGLFTGASCASSYGTAMGSTEVQRRHVLRRFAEFADHYPGLPLYRAICTGCLRDPDVASLLLQARPGQLRPVLLFAALHHVVLQNPHTRAARWYASVAGRDRYIAAMLGAAAADLPDLPVTLLELGASAGLLLAADRYDLTMRRDDGDLRLGDPASAVSCVGEDRTAAGDRRPWRLPAVTERIGVDVNPVHVDDDDGMRWLQACLWPDVPGRVELFAAAAAQLRACPAQQRPVLVAGNMVDDLPAVLHRHAGAHLVVLSSWAVTYVDRDRRALIAEHLGEQARATGQPVSWVSAEPVGCVPGVPASQ
ncbi:MAG: hypothetical protein CSB46_11825, partial [Micrococcales bacterium]